MDDSIGALAAEYEFFGEPAGLLDTRVLKGHGIAALGGAGGALLTEAIFGMESVSTYFADKPGWRALAQFALGIAGARGIYHFESGESGHPAAYGFAGQVAGSAAAGGAMMLYHQYAAPAASSGTAGLGYGRRGMYGLAGEEVTQANYLQTNGLSGETAVVPVQPYYDRYKVSVPMGTGAAVHGLGEEAASPAGQPAWPEDEETPDVGTWIG